MCNNYELRSLNHLRLLGCVLCFDTSIDTKLEYKLLERRCTWNISLCRSLKLDLQNVKSDGLPALVGYSNTLDFSSWNVNNSDNTGDSKQL